MIPAIGQRWRYKFSDYEQTGRCLEYVVEIIGIDESQIIVKLLQLIINVGFPLEKTKHLSHIGNVFVATTLATSWAWSYLEGQDKSIE